VYYPVLQNFQLSLYSWNAFSRAPRYVGMDNYATMIADEVFWRALWNNVVYAVVSLVFQVFFSLILAAILEEFVHRRLAGFLRALYFIPAVISITVSGILFSFIYNPEFGLLNKLLQAIGLGGLTRAWLGEEGTAMGSVIAMSQWQSFGYTAVLFIVAIQRIPRELYESARIDGAGRVRTFLSITFPLVREMTTLLVIITISGAFLVFNEVMVMTAGGPAQSTHVLGTWLYFNAFMADDMGYASAIASFIFVITLALAIGQLAYGNRKRVEW
jgi:raffinose/stachyose/melibiose transport system permease protein